MSVQITNYQELADKERRGFCAVSLDSLVTTTAITIKSGSVVEVAGALYEFQADETESGGTWAGIGNSNVVYVYIVPAGSTATFIYSTTAPTWDTAKAGWYTGGTSRAVVTLFKDAGGLYQAKAMIRPVQTVGPEPINSGAPDVAFGRLHHLPLGNTTSRSVFSSAPPAAAAWSAAQTGSGVVGVPTGAKGIRVALWYDAYSTVAGMALAKMFFSDNNSNVPSLSTGHPRMGFQGYSDVAGHFISDGGKEVDIPLNSSGQFYIYSLTQNNITIASSILYMTVVGYYMGD